MPGPANGRRASRSRCATPASSHCSAQGQTISKCRRNVGTEVPDGCVIETGYWRRIPAGYWIDRWIHNGHGYIMDTGMNQGKGLENVQNLDPPVTYDPPCGLRCRRLFTFTSQFHLRCCCCKWPHLEVTGRQRLPAGSLLPGSQRLGRVAPSPEGDGENAVIPPAIRQQWATSNGPAIGPNFGPGPKLGQQ